MLSGAHRACVISWPATSCSRGAQVVSRVQCQTRVCRYILRRKLLRGTLLSGEQTEQPQQQNAVFPEPRAPRILADGRASHGFRKAAFLRSSFASDYVVCSPSCRLHQMGQSLIERFCHMGHVVPLRGWLCTRSTAATRAFPTRVFKSALRVRMIAGCMRSLFSRRAAAPHGTRILLAELWTSAPR